MNKSIWLGLALALTVGLYAGLRREPPQVGEGLQIARILSDPAPDARYARADTARDFAFPADHGPHADFRHEWWYFTGNLTDASGRPFGFQLTFFRYAIAPADTASASAWRTRQVLLAHFAVTDIRGQHFHSRARSARAALGLAGLTADPAAVWIRDWRCELLDPERGQWRLRAADDGIELDLTVSALKPEVLQGERGLSQKSAAPGNASYYYSVTRLGADGRLAIGADTHRVSGSAWLDREWSTSALGADQAGWDWFALQLSDGSELMYYELRRRGGGIDAHSRGVYVSADGRSERIGHEQLRIDVARHWISPQTGIRYPAGWRLTLAATGLALEIRPRLAAQEWPGPLRYWEGAVNVRGERAGRPLEGVGYVELTGYEASR